MDPAAQIAEFAQSEAEPDSLPKPKSGADLAPFFDQYHQNKKDGQKITLAQIAQETGFSYDYIRQLHSKYLKLRRLSKPKKTSHKRTHKN